MHKTRHVCTELQTGNNEMLCLWLLTQQCQAGVYARPRLVVAVPS